MQTLPNSTIYLCKNVELDPNYNYTIDFDSLSAQEAYFDDKIATEFDINVGYTFVRDTQQIKVQAHVDDLLGINYLFYNNGNKRYYAFITRKDYISPTCTSLTFKLDVLQSFMFNYEISESFIEREHQDRYDSTLKPIYNLVPENLDAGTDMDIVSSEKIKDNASAPNGLVWIEVVATQAIATGNYSNTQPATWKNYCSTLDQKGVRTQLYVYLCPYILGTSMILGNRFYTYSGESTIVRLDNIYEYASRSTAILSARVLHYSPIKYNISAYNDGYLISFPDGYRPTPQTYDGTNMRVVTANNSNFGGVDLRNIGGNYLNLSNITINNENFKLSILQLTAVTPVLNIENLKNKNYETKLLTYPYQYQQVCDYQTTPLTIKNEYLEENKYICSRQSHGGITKSKYFVEGYNNDNGKEYNTINSTISELPLTNDAYATFMAQNKASATTGVALNIVGSLATLGIGIATGGVGLAVAGATAIGLAGQVGSQMVKIQDLKNTPDSIRQAGNNAEFDLLDTNYQLTLTKFKIKQQYYDIIFNYLYHFGYKCNDFKVPNTRSRYYFNYIKTIGANIKSNIDAEYRAQIENVLNNGVTIWHYRDSDTFKGVNNYEYENVEINLMEE